MKTLYEMLGVAVDATEAQIKRAYRKHAKKNHPDRGGDADKFREVTHAYEVLTDPVRRKRYDETGQGGDPKQAEAVQKQMVMMSQIIIQAIQANPMGCNPIQSGRDILNSKIQQLKRVAEIDRDQARRIRHMASNVIRTGEGENIVAAVLESHASGGDSHADTLDAEAEGLRQVLTLFDDYQWKPDNQPSKPNYEQALHYGSKWLIQ